MTTCEAVEHKLAVHREAIQDADLNAAWERVVAVMVQPDIEFDHHSVVDYDAAKSAHLQL